MNPAPRAASWPLVLLAAIAAALACRFWMSLCFAPFVDWNDIRLAPTFMLWHGFSPAHGENE